MKCHKEGYCATHIPIWHLFNSQLQAISDFLFMRSWDQGQTGLHCSGILGHKFLFSLT